MENKRLVRNENDRVIAGVCSGIADYFGWDPTLVRIGFLLFCAAGGSGFLVYVIAAILMDPRRQF